MDITDVEICEKSITPAGGFWLIKVIKDQVIFRSFIAGISEWTLVFTR